MAGKLPLAVTGPAGPGPKLSEVIPSTLHGAKFGTTLRAGPEMTIELVLPLPSTVNDAVALDAGVPGSALFFQHPAITPLAGDPLRAEGAADSTAVGAVDATAVGAVDAEGFALGVVDVG